jgi:hypothetical protein
MEADEFDFLSVPQPWHIVKAEITLCAFIDGPIRNLAKLDNQLVEGVSVNLQLICASRHKHIRDS